MYHRLFLEPDVHFLWDVLRQFAGTVAPTLVMCTSSQTCTPRSSGSLHSQSEQPRLDNTFPVTSKTTRVFPGGFFFLILSVRVFVCAQVSGSEEEVHHRTEGATAKRAEPLHSPEHHQSHHGHEVLPGENVSSGGL